MSSNSVARQRWFLVKEALKTNRNVINQSKLSGRKFSGYSLYFREIAVNDDGDDDKHTEQNGRDAEFSWRRFSLANSADNKFLDVRIYSDRIKVEDLTGFNNTGNVCIWPSEDVLAHYLTAGNLPLANFKRICELGGGMTSLAGLAVATLVEFDEVLLTDGNEKSVANIEAIIKQNSSVLRSKNVHAKCLRWGEIDEQLCNHFDLIICADCLFFKECHSVLCDTILKLLTDGGFCYMVAPARGDSLTAFVDLVRSTAKDVLTVSVRDRYDEQLWQASQELISQTISNDPHTTTGLEYSIDQHYPLLIEISKAKSL